MTRIHQTNTRLKAAIAAVRFFGRDASTMCEVRDAINQRRSRRDYRMPQAEAEARQSHYLRQLRTYGMVEQPYRESHI